MRLPRVRFTIRRLMVVVAVVATVLAIGIELRGLTVKRHYNYPIRNRLEWLVDRRDHFQRLANYHLEKAGERHIILDSSDSGPHLTTRRGYWHYQLWKKYSDAAIRPWLPVAPDPPDPGPE